MGKSFVEKYNDKIEAYKSWGKFYEECEDAVKGLPCRKFKFSIEGKEICTDEDFHFDETNINFSNMPDVLEDFDDKNYSQMPAYGLELGFPFYANKVNFNKEFRIEYVGDYKDWDFEIPKFEVEYLMYDSEKVSNDLCPFLEFAQFICWKMIRSIGGRYSDIQRYIQFFAELIKKFDDVNFSTEKDGKWTYCNFHPIKETFVFGGNAEGVINVSLEEVKDE